MQTNTSNILSIANRSKSLIERH